MSTTISLSQRAPTRSRRLNLVRREREIGAITKALGIGFFMQHNDADARLYTVTALAIGQILNHCRRRQSCADTSENRRAFGGIARLALPGNRPAATLQSDVIGSRTGDQKPRQVFWRRQQISSILKQHTGLAYRLPRHLTMFGRPDAVQQCPLTIGLVE